jgi:hypothetical protein
VEQKRVVPKMHAGHPERKVKAHREMIGHTGEDAISPVRNRCCHAERSLEPWGLCAKSDLRHETGWLTPIHRRITRRIAVNALGKIVVEVSEAGINAVLAQLDYRHTVDRMLETRTGDHFLRFGGPVTLDGLAIHIEGASARVQGRVSNKFSIEYSLPVVGHGVTKVRAFELSLPPLSVALWFEGAEARLALGLVGLTPSTEDPPTVDLRGEAQAIFQKLWGRLYRELGPYFELVVDGINEELRRRPIPLFDLTDLAIPIGGGRKLQVRPVIEQLNFAEGALKGVLRIESV